SSDRGRPIHFGASLGSTFRASLLRCASFALAFEVSEQAEKIGLDSGQFVADKFRGGAYGLQDVTPGRQLDPFPGGSHNPLGRWLRVFSPALLPQCYPAPLAHHRSHTGTGTTKT